MDAFVNWDGYDVKWENVHFAGPAAHSRVAIFEQTLQEKRIHAVHFWEALDLLATLAEQLHVEVDDLVVQPR